MERPNRSMLIDVQELSIEATGAAEPKILNQRSP
jgi:hypothetical protein